MWSIYLLLKPTQYAYTLLNAQHWENVQCALEVNTKQWGQPIFNVYFKIIWFSYTEEPRVSLRCITSFFSLGKFNVIRVTDFGTKDRKLLSWPFYFVRTETRMSSSWNQLIQIHFLEYSNAVHLLFLMYAFGRLFFPWTSFGWMLQNVFCRVFWANSSF